MKTILLFSILMISSYARSEGVRIISKSLESSIGIQAIKGDVTDTRLDVNGDSNTDAMTLKKGGTVTDILNTSNGKKVYIEDISEKEKTVVEGTISNDRLKVDSIIRIKNSTIPSKGSGLESINEICDRIKSNQEKFKAADLSNLSKTQMENVANSLFSENCGEEYHRDLNKRSLNGFLMSIVGNSNRKSCLEQVAEDSKVALKEKKISEEEMLKYQLALYEARSETVDLLEGKGKVPQFTCEKEAKSGFSLSPNGIKIKYNDTADTKSPTAALMQKWGVPGDVNEIISKCKSGESIFLNRKQRKLTDLQVSSYGNSYSVESLKTSTAFKESVRAASKEEVAAVNANLAQTKVTIPSPTEASPQALAKIQATQGDAAVQQVMAKQSSGIMTMTNAVMSAVNTQAVAASGSKSGSSRSVASTKSDTSLSSTSNKTRSSIGGLKKTNIGKDEQIVEEILVGGNNTRTANTARRVGTQVLNNGAVISRAPANADGVETNDATAAGGVNPELGGAGRASGGGGGGSASSGGGRGGKKSGGGGGQAANAAGNTRSPASASSSDSAPENVSSDEIVSFIKNSDYQSTKSKLQDYKFQNKLKSNFITIIDRSGNSIGAAEGKIIFVDKGNRFEKQ